MNTIKINEIKQKIEDNKKFFEAAKPMKIFKTEYSLGGPETSNCDIHEIQDTDDGVHRIPAVFAELIRGKVKEITWFCPKHNNMFFDVKKKAKKEIERLEKRLLKLESPIV